jgi:hypothetical protein
MTPFQPKPSFTSTGSRLVNLTLDPFCFMFNSFALGDVVASVPVVKHMVEHHYTQPDSYAVVAKQHFRPLFPFVPDENFKDFDEKGNCWGLGQGFSMALLNKKNDGIIVRNTPKHMHLSEFGSIMLSDRILPKSELNYVPLDPVDVSKFNVDFSKAVVLVTSFRDVTRSWHADQILATATWIKSKGFIPVFIGKTDMDATAKESVRPKNSLPDDISEYGVDLRNQTTISELASIIDQSRAICGMDSGPIHLAGTTKTPIICGYTSVSPEYRMPIRKEGVTYPIVPEIECIGCESRWATSYWNFENCYLTHARCCSLMTADKFIKILDSIL